MPVSSARVLKSMPSTACSWLSRPSEIISPAPSKRHDRPVELLAHDRGIGRDQQGGRGPERVETEQNVFAHRGIPRSRQTEHGLPRSAQGRRARSRRARTAPGCRGTARSRFPGELLGDGAAMRRATGSSACFTAAPRSSLSAPAPLPVRMSRGPGHRKGGDREAAGQRFQDHQAERVGEAGEDEDVGGGDSGGPDPRRPSCPGNALSGTCASSCSSWGPSPITTWLPGRSSARKASMFFSIGDAADEEMDRPRQVQQRLVASA